MTPRIIAEIGTAHEGDVARARELVHAARDAGADTAKFQLVRAAEILHPRTGTVDLPGGSVALFDRFRSLERPDAFYAELKTICDEAGVSFLCTPFGLGSARTLRYIAVDEIKIASPEMNHFPLLQEVATYDIPLIVSAGVARLCDIDESVDLLRSLGRIPTLLHCITAYPAPEEEYNLRVLASLRNVLGIPVGISDHSIDPILVPALATLLGTAMIEKHITLGKNDGGLDDSIALEPAEFAAMTSRVRSIARRLADNSEDPVAHRRTELEILQDLRNEFGINRVDRVLGDGVKRLAPSEERSYGYTNRSIHALRDLAPGETLTEETIAILRSERNLSPGLHPRYWTTILGTTVSRPVAAGSGIGWADLFHKRDT